MSENLIQSNEDFLSGKQGFYLGLDFEIYKSLKAINASSLKEMNRSPLHFKYLYDNHKRDSESLSLGRAAHKAIFENEEFKKFKVMPKFDGRTTVGKEGKAKWLLDNEGVELIEQDEYNLATEMRDACYNHSTAKVLLETKSYHELSMVWEDNGVLCKGRIDRYIMEKGSPVVLDLKTTQDAREEFFWKDIKKWMYYYSLSFYLRGLEIIRNKSHKRAIIVAVESSAPHGVLVRELGAGWIANGLWQIEEHLKTFKKCTDVGIWDGYTNEIITSHPPAFLFPNT